MWVIFDSKEIPVRSLTAGSAIAESYDILHDFRNINTFLWKFLRKISIKMLGTLQNPVQMSKSNLLHLWITSYITYIQDHIYYDWFHYISKLDSALLFKKGLKVLRVTNFLLPTRSLLLVGTLAILISYLIPGKYTGNPISKPVHFTTCVAHTHT